MCKKQGRKRLEKRKLTTCISLSMISVSHSSACMKIWKGITVTKPSSITNNELPDNMMMSYQNESFFSCANSSSNDMSVDSGSIFSVEFSDFSINSMQLPISSIWKNRRLVQSNHQLWLLHYSQ
ncbi:hypothetical protein SDJN02_24192, partial [Cucurbita argyrosperma subsp. argyrosperma]